MPSTTRPSPTIHLPSDKIANLSTVCLQDLASGSAAERARMLKACIEDGFFYLDLTKPKTQGILDDVDTIFGLSENLFNYPTEIKNLFDVDKISPGSKVNGYKPKGRNVVAKDGSVDGFESWVLPRNGLLQLSKEAFSHPPSVSDNQAVLRNLVDGLTLAAHAIFNGLSTALSVPAGQRFEDCQGINNPSPDILRLLKYHANERPTSVPQTPHTDLGSLTFVFSDTPGLQVLPPNVTQKAGAYTEDDWLYVEPRAGHAIVNVGDCLTIMTNGVLKSALHRVGPVAGCEMPERYSMAYLMRPEDCTVLRPVDSPLVPVASGNPADYMTSGAWISKKFKALRGQKDAGNIDQILTGGRGVLA